LQAVALVPHCLVQDDIAAGLVSTPLDDGYMDVPVLPGVTQPPEALEQLQAVVAERSPEDATAIFRLA
jgi:hypothetical protein